MSLNNQGRPTRPDDSAVQAPDMATFTGNRGLDVEEPLIFEVGDPGKTGVDLPHPKTIEPRLGGLRREQPIGLPGLTEPEAMRHYAVSYTHLRAHQTF